MSTPKTDKASETPKPAPESDTEKKKREASLDEGLDETFPASDPTAAQDPDVHQRRAEKGLD